MNPFLLQFANGNSLFAGFAIACLACLIPVRKMPRALQALVTITALVGGILVILSATPFPYWIYGAWGINLAACILLQKFHTTRIRYRLLCLTGLFCFSAALSIAELAYHQPIHIPFPKEKPLYVIGDSLAAGTDAKVAPWPDRLARLSQLQVTNLALGGNTVSGALAEAKTIRQIDGSVLLEIGGNDILSTCTVSEFEQALQDLLREVCIPGRVVAMFELPLPPFANAFGAAQRRQARSFGVYLIPKQCMASVLGAPEATTDGLHLSATGHQKMAELLSAMVNKNSETK